MNIGEKNFQVAEQLTRPGQTTREKTERIERFFQDNFEYTLDTNLMGPEHPLPEEHPGAKAATWAGLAAQEAGRGIYPSTSIEVPASPELAAAMKAARRSARRAAAKTE